VTKAPRVSREFTFSLRTKAERGRIITGIRLKRIEAMAAGISLMESMDNTIPTNVPNTMLTVRT